MKVSNIGNTVNGIQYVVCKKSIANFKVGCKYIISGMYGDPQGALEAGYDYMVTDFLNNVIVMDGKTINENEPILGAEYHFEWKGRKNYMWKYKNIGYFQDYFFLTIAEERKLKLNILNEK